MLTINRKGFTAVELLVIITIAVIVGTIIFSDGDKEVAEKEHKEFVAMMESGATLAKKNAVKIDDVNAERAKLNILNQAELKAFTKKIQDNGFLAASVNIDDIKALSETTDDNRKLAKSFVDASNVCKTYDLESSCKDYVTEYNLGAKTLESFEEFSMSGDKKALESCSEKNYAVSEETLNDYIVEKNLCSNVSDSSAYYDDYDGVYRIGDSYGKQIYKLASKNYYEVSCIESVQAALDSKYKEGYVVLGDNADKLYRSTCVDPIMKRMELVQAKVEARSSEIEKDISAKIATFQLTDFEKTIFADSLEKGVSCRNIAKFGGNVESQKVINFCISKSDTKYNDLINKLKTSK